MVGCSVTTAFTDGKMSLNTRSLPAHRLLVWHEQKTSLLAMTSRLAVPLATPIERSPYGRMRRWWRGACSHRLQAVWDLWARRREADVVRPASRNTTVTLQHCRSAFQRKLTILSTTIIIQAVHNYKSDNTIPENVS